ncbi:uncharacterized protein UBRO_20002 [Ustilago bromivora]|uniref:Uncharacterized protein n=1 Tax=Ustilago bromivora TaxID=307758 RepID=A0A1K0GBX3_9BASI|nr:uncharacterized protein UBRO_20002 [Ustilago bromivora]
MGHPIDAGMKLSCLLCSIQPLLCPYTTAYEAQWESLALSKTTNVAGTPSADFELQLGRLFEATAMGMRNYEESVHLKEQETGNTTLITCFANLGGYQQHSSTSSQGQPNTTTTNQVACWKCGVMGPEACTGRTGFI